MLREIVGQAAQSRMELAGGAEVVDRLGQRSAQQEGPDAVDGRAAEVGVPPIDHPGGELFAGVPLVGQQLGAKRHARLDLDRLLGLAVGGHVIVFGVMDAAQVGVGAAEEGRQAAEIRLLPGLKRVVVALGTVDPRPQKRPGNPCGQPVGGRPARVRVESHRDEIGRGMIGPETAVGDQFA